MRPASDSTSVWPARSRSGGRPTGRRAAGPPPPCGVVSLTAGGGEHDRGAGALEPRRRTGPAVHRPMPRRACRSDMNDSSPGGRVQCWEAVAVSDEVTIEVEVLVVGPHTERLEQPAPAAQYVLVEGEGRAVASLGDRRCPVGH